MLIALLCWMGFSAAFCLAFFFVAARPMPQEEQAVEASYQTEARHQRQPTTTVASTSATDRAFAASAPRQVL